MMVARSKGAAAKFTALLVAFVACAMTLPFVALDSSANEPVIAPQDNEIVINSESTFLNFYDRMAVENEGLRGFIVNLEADISLENAILPIGYVVDAFQGTFNGGGHTINVKLACSNENIGLFSKIGDSGSVINLKLNMTAGTASENIVLNDTIEQRFIGFVAGVNEGNIADCEVVSTSSMFLKSDKSVSVGGIAGKSTGSITGCTFSGKIAVEAFNSESRGEMFAAGLVGQNTGGITGSTFKGNVNVGANATHFNAVSGGIASINSGTISECISGYSGQAHISVGGMGDVNVGGIAGNNAGSVTLCETKPLVFEINKANLLKAGGIAGLNDGRISECSNATEMSIASPAPTYCNVGGITGWNNGSLVDCSNSANLNPSGSNAISGGIAGCVSGQSAKVVNCVNSANIGANGTGSAYAGGIIGIIYQGTLENSYSKGNISVGSQGCSAGGLVGEIMILPSATINISNCVSYGNVTIVGQGTIGGPVGTVLADGGTLNVTNGFWHSSDTTGYATSSLFMQILTFQSGDGSFGEGDNLRSRLNTWVRSNINYAEDGKQYRPWKQGAEGSMPLLHDTLIRLYHASDVSYLTGASFGDASLDVVEVPQNWSGDYNVIVGCRATKLTNSTWIFTGQVNTFTDSLGWIHKRSFLTLYKDEVCVIQNEQHEGNGTVTYNPSSVKLGECLQVIVSPAEEYYVKSISVGGYTINGVQTVPIQVLDNTLAITITYGQKYNIVVNVNDIAYGTVTPGTSFAEPGVNMVFAIIPLEGYGVLSVELDGINQMLPTGGGTINLDNVSGNHTINVRFEAHFMLSPTITGRGNVLPSNIEVFANDEIIFNILPDEGYYIHNLNIGGYSAMVDANNQIHIRTSHAIAIEVEFVAYLHVILTVSGEGNVSSDKVLFKQNEEINIMALPGNGMFVGWSDGNQEAVRTMVPSADVILTANFRKPTIFVENPAEGQITPGTISVNRGSTQAFEIIPNSGFKVQDVIVDGHPIGSLKVHAFDNIVADHTLSAVFATVSSYTVTVSCGPGGTTNSASEFTITEGESRTIRMMPDDGYRVKNVTIDRASIGAVTTYTLSDVTSDRYISVTFERIPKTVFTIGVSCGEGGTMDPPSSFTVQSGNRCTVTITPNKGYVVKDVAVDGVSVGSVSSYSFAEVISNRFISATFERISENVYTVSVSCGEGGTMDPPSSFVLTPGSNRTVNITPNKGYAVKDVVVDGSSVGPVPSYTFSGVSSNHSISVVFERMFTINVSCGEGGTMDPPSKSTIASGGSRTFTITPNKGYAIKDVAVDGVSVGSVSSYTFSNVKSDRYISVTFERVYTMTISCGEGGTTDPSAQFTIPYGGSRPVKITPNTGYVVKDVRVDGTSVGPVFSYDFTKVSANHDMKVYFEKEEKCTVTLVVEGEGSVSGEGQYAKDAIATVSAQPADGFKFVSWSDGGAQIHAFSVTKETALTAKFEKIAGKTFLVAVNIGAGGSYVGNTAVPHGESVKITIVPDEGYRIDSVQVDGVDIGSPSFVTLDSVASDHRLEINFSEFRNAVTTMSEDGTISTVAEFTDGSWRINLDAVSRPDGTSDVKVRVADESMGVWTEFRGKDGEAKIFVGGDLVERQTFGYMVLNGPSGEDMVMNAVATQHAMHGLDKVRTLLTSTSGTDTIVLVDIPSGGDGSLRSTIKVDGETLKLLAEKGCAFQIVSGIARTEFDSITIQGLANGSNAVFITRTVDPNMLDEELSEILGGRKTYAVSVLLGDNEIKNLKGKMTLYMFVSPRVTQDPEDFSIIMADTGGYSREVHAQFITKSSEVYFVTDRLAYYGLILGGDDAPVNKDYTSILVIIGAVAMVAGAIAVFSYRVRRKRSST